MLRLDDKCVGEKLLVADIDRIVDIEIFIEKAFELSEIPSSFVCHLRQPNIFPHRNVMAFDIFEK
jgi:hypothetical protein